MKKQFILMFLICSVFAFCKSENNSKDSELTTAFNAYLKNTFHIGIPNKKEFYFLVPASQCRACNLYDGDQLNSSLNENLIVITTFPKTNFQHFRHLWIDTSQTLQSLLFVDFTNKLVVTEGGKVQSISMVSNFYQQLDSLNQKYSN